MCVGDVCAMCLRPHSNNTARKRQALGPTQGAEPCMVDADCCWWRRERIGDVVLYCGVSEVGVAEGGRERGHNGIGDGRWKKEGKG